MKYQIVGSFMPYLQLTLNRGETVYTEKGGMSWMTEHIKMETHGRGGIMGFIGRKLAGESFFLNHFTAERDGVWLVFTPEVPGSIIPVMLEKGQSVIAQRDAFMVASDSVNLSVHLSLRLGSGLFGGEGFILQKIEGPGMAFFEVGGEMSVIELKQGEVLKVNPGHVAMYEPSIDYDIQTVRGIRNLLFGGEGIFVAKLTGPGRVWLQSMPFTELVNMIYAALPKPEVQVNAPNDDNKDADKK